MRKKGTVQRLPGKFLDGLLYHLPDLVCKYFDYNEKPFKWTFLGLGWYVGAGVPERIFQHSDVCMGRDSVWDQIFRKLYMKVR